MASLLQFRRRDLGAAVLALSLAASQAWAAQTSRPWKMLLFAAHPDDEYYFAATTYRLAQKLNATVDQMAITDGEAGYRYSLLAERVYGVRLTDEATGRRLLPEIRRRETISAGKILGIRRHAFLNEKDARSTLNAGETPTSVWNCNEVDQKLRTQLEREKYDFVFVLLPNPYEHGHHQAAAVLALDVVREMNPADRPVVLGAEPGTGAETPIFRVLGNFPVTAASSPEPSFSFDRKTRFGFQDSLNYEIVVQWVIAEHKSQGMFQTETGKHDVENFWRFAVGPQDADARTQSLARSLTGENTMHLQKVAQR